jgi:hypothetical protein
MVFKIIGEALPGSVASWTFSGCARRALKIIPCISRVPFGALAACWPPRICSVGVGRLPSSGCLLARCSRAAVLRR